MATSVPAPKNYPPAKDGKAQPMGGRKGGPMGGGAKSATPSDIGGGPKGMVPPKKK